MLSLQEQLEKLPNLLCNKRFHYVYRWFEKRQSKIQCIHTNPKFVRKNFKCSTPTLFRYINTMKKHNEASVERYMGTGGFVKVIFW